MSGPCGNNLCLRAVCNHLLLTVCCGRCCRAVAVGGQHDESQHVLRGWLQVLRGRTPAVPAAWPLQPQGGADDCIHRTNKGAHRGQAVSCIQRNYLEISDDSAQVLFGAVSVGGSLVHIPVLLPAVFVIKVALLLMVFSRGASCPQAEAGFPVSISVFHKQIWVRKL